MARLAEGFIGSEVLAKLGRLGALSELAAEGDAQTRRMLAPVIEMEVAALVGNAERKHAARLVKLAEPLATRAMQRVARSQAKTHRRQMEALTEGMDVVQVLALAHQAATQRAQRGGVLGDATSIKLTAGGGVQHPENKPWGSGDFGLGLSTPGLRQAMDEAVAENVDLITRLPERLYRDLRKRLAVELRQGRQIDQLHQVVSAELLNAKRRSSPMAAMMRRARLIARDQVGKFHGKLDEERQQGAGITHYRWRTVRDERVRGGPKYRDAVPSHAHREGKIFAWAKPPHEDKTDGHPGRPIQCRCYPEPVLDAPDGEYGSEPPESMPVVLGKRKPRTPVAIRVAHKDLPPSLRKLAPVGARLVNGQIEPKEGRANRRTIRAILRSFGITSRDMVMHREHRYRTIIEVKRMPSRASAAHNWDGDMWFTVKTYKSLDGLRAERAWLGRREADGLRIRLHEGLHDGGPAEAESYTKGTIGVFVEEVTTEVLARSYGERYLRRHGLYIDAFSAVFEIKQKKAGAYYWFINPALKAFRGAGLATTERGAAKLLVQASEEYKSGRDVVSSPGEAGRRWVRAILSTVEGERGRALTVHEKRDIVARYKDALDAAGGVPTDGLPSSWSEDARRSISDEGALGVREERALRLLLEMHEAGELLPGVGVDAILPGLEAHPLACRRPDLVRRALAERGVKMPDPAFEDGEPGGEQFKPGILALHRRGLVSCYDMHAWAMHGLGQWMHENGITADYTADVELC